MKLYIDTSDSEVIKVGLDGKIHEEAAKKEKSQKLLPTIVKLLEEKGKKVADITEIEVNTGPGSFTGLRVGVSVANALGWALGVPVNKKDLESGESVEIDYE